MSEPARAFSMPASWSSFRDPTGKWAAWLDRLPGLARDLLADFELRRDGATRHGYASIVLPVVTSEDRPAALKIGFPHTESQHEHLALQRWGGDGAVRLLRADPSRGALLLERLHDVDLTDLWDVEACELVGERYDRLHVAALPQLRTLTSFVDRWTEGLARLPRSAPLPRRLVEQAVSLGRDFVSDPASNGRMIHTDLHYENVLAAEREPWLVIDPKPMSGDPHYEPAPLLWNRWTELAGDVRGGLRRRFHAVVDAAGLDEDRARDWVVVRLMHLAAWALDGDSGTVDVAEQLTRCVTIVKAVQE